MTHNELATLSKVKTPAIRKVAEELLEAIIKRDAERVRPTHAEWSFRWETR